jgi:hypothetical protein
MKPSLPLTAPKPTCRECDHAEVLASTDKAIRCRRYPPTVTAVVVPIQAEGEMSIQIKDITLRPIVSAAETCGEWKKAFILVSH